MQEGQAAEDETYEVDGMVVHSLPARNRRRRNEARDEEELAEGADTHDASTAKVRIQAAEGSAVPASHVQEATEATVELRQYEYMDHTADVILHSWGKTLPEAFSQVCVCMFSYMTDLDTVDCETSVDVEATGHDMLDLLYHLLDEFLFSFGTELIAVRFVDILEFDQENLRIRARGRGERFNLKKHPQGTEIKAITMHQMKVLTPETLTSEDGTVPREHSDKEGGAMKQGFPFECYVLVDI